MFNRYITGHNTFLYGSVNGPKLLGKRKQKLKASKKVCYKLYLQGLHELIFFFRGVVDKIYAVISQFNIFESLVSH